MITTNLAVPKEVWARMTAFLEAGKTGSIVLDIKEGQVLAWKVIESGRVHNYKFDKDQLYPIR